MVSNGFARNLIIELRGAVSKTCFTAAAHDDHGQVEIDVMHALRETLPIQSGHF